jgi:DNA polymerase III epsilon subunit-like protein
MADFVFLDTETTGLDDDAELVEIAVVDDTGAVLFESYCRPTVPVDPGAQAVHGIGPEKLATAPAWPEIAERVRAALEGKTVVIFNSDFDTRILVQTATAHTDGLDTECAMYRAADAFGATNQYGTISLINAAAAAGVEFQGKAHSAAGDAATTAELWRCMMTSRQ